MRKLSLACLLSANSVVASGLNFSWRVAIAYRKDQLWAYGYLSCWSCRWFEILGRLTKAIFYLNKADADRFSKNFIDNSRAHLTFHTQWSFTLNSRFRWKMELSKNTFSSWKGRNPTKRWYSPTKTGFHRPKLVEVSDGPTNNWYNKRLIWWSNS